MQSKKSSGSRYGRAGAYFICFLILLAICVFMYIIARFLPERKYHMDTNMENTPYPADVSNSSDGISYNLIGELVYEALYDGLSEDEVMKNMEMLGYSTKEVQKAVNELGLDWEQKKLTNTESGHFQDLVKSGIISKTGQIP